MQPEVQPTTSQINFCVLFMIFFKEYIAYLARSISVCRCHFCHQNCHVFDLTNDMTLCYVEICVYICSLLGKEY